MTDTLLSTSLRQFVYPAGKHNSGINSYLQFCARFNIQPYPASSLTLQFFCTDLSQRISYKSIKAGIRLAHLECGHLDPTVDESLRLVIRGIQCLQGESCHHQLPITINLLRTLKQQICISNYSLVEQCLLWAAFMTAFYGFLQVSEFTSSCSDDAILRWSDIQLSSSTLTITLRQSKTDPFRRGHFSNKYFNLPSQGTTTI